MKTRSPSPDATRARGARASLGIAVARLGRDQRGATAVEFSLVAVPFFALIFAIFNTAFAIFAANTLETAVADTARLIRTGQAQTSGLTADTFKAKICGQLVYMFNCNAGLYVDVETYPTFGTIALSLPLDTNKNLKTTGYAFTPGHGGDIVVVRAFYAWPIIVNGLGNNFANLGNGDLLLAATSAFRNEPFSW